MVSIFCDVWVGNFWCKMVSESDETGQEVTWSPQCSRALDPLPVATN